jgi:hypothetical protein
MKQSAEHSEEFSASCKIYFKEIDLLVFDFSGFKQADKSSVVKRFSKSREERQSFVNLFKYRNNRHSNFIYTGCPRVAKKLHNLFVIKDINFYLFLDDSYASTAHSENIAGYIQCVSIL